MLDVHLLSEQRMSGGPRAEDRPLLSRSIDLLAYLVLHAGTPQARQHLAFVFCRHLVRPRPARICDASCTTSGA